jgi:hypothetical protein
VVSTLGDAVSSAAAGSAGARDGDADDGPADAEVGRDHAYTIAPPTTAAITSATDCQWSDRNVVARA